MLTAIVTLALLSPGVQGGAKTSTLTMDEIKRRFTIPVFIVASPANVPLTTQDKEKKNYMNVFFGKKECDSFVEAVKKQGKINNIQTKVMSLADIIGMDAIEKWFVPMESELKNANEFLKKSDPKAKDFASTPLFYLEAKTGYVTVVQNGKTAIPFFFAMKGAEALLKKAQDGKVEGAKIKLTSFEQVYDTLRSQPMSQTDQIQFVVHPDAIEQYRALKGDG